MNIYKISAEGDRAYDTYSDAVVVAEDEHDARLIHPDGESQWVINPFYEDTGPDEFAWIDDHTWDNTREWTSPNRVKVELVGIAAPGVVGPVIVASYHAG